MSQPVRRLVLLVAAIVTASCVGPQGGHREGKEWPTVPEPHSAHLYGQVRDFVTGEALVGAKVHAEVDSSLTNVDGRYTIANLRMQMVILVTSHPGYDTTRTQLALPNGDLQWNIRLRQSTPVQ
jgi:hypothetical protein